MCWREYLETEFETRPDVWPGRGLFQHNIAPSSLGPGIQHSDTTSSLNKSVSAAYLRWRNSKYFSVGERQIFPVR